MDHPDYIERSNLIVKVLNNILPQEVINHILHLKNQVLENEIKDIRLYKDLIEFYLTISKKDSVNLCVHDSK